MECLAPREGLKLALEKDFKGILVESDSFATIQLLRDEWLSNHELGNSIFFYCESMFQRLGSEAKHVFREACFCADAAMASLSIPQLSLVTFNSMPT